MAKAFLLLGGNIDNKFKYLARAESLISSVIGDIVDKSSYYESAPWGFIHKSFFLNKVVVVETILSPLALLLHINQIENMMGRIRKSDQYIERNIDIDILLYDNKVINDDNLIIPHLKLHQRRFALEPVCEIASEQIHPVLNVTFRQLLNECEDLLEVRRLEDKDVPNIKID
ncbi:MAG: 2-amino-4-hydroxy-6-hydroxymethyldihydropteridine diphosphokinase [Bacteroidetes bacterium GWA2_30_7]|nr:MAG: 2-amino-4-hydroxy-6-hydroxymethyldihydropteridine diphosphokinase [Bacteroidetes bacterium GWA2_30_7]